jgi:hypothetical protein
MGFFSLQVKSLKCLIINIKRNSEAYFSYRTRPYLRVTYYMHSFVFPHINFLQILRTEKTACIATVFKLIPNYDRAKKTERASSVGIVAGYWFDGLGYVLRRDSSTSRGLWGPVALTCSGYQLQLHHE